MRKYWGSWPCDACTGTRKNLENTSYVTLSSLERSPTWLAYNLPSATFYLLTFFFLQLEGETFPIRELAKDRAITSLRRAA